MLQFSPNKLSVSKTSSPAKVSLKVGTKTKKQVISPFKSPVKRASVAETSKPMSTGGYSNKYLQKLAKPSCTPGTKVLTSDSNCKISF